jgi:hypothetical protein
MNNYKNSDKKEIEKFKCFELNELNDVNFCSDKTYKLTIGCILFFIILFLFSYLRKKSKTNTLII